MLNTRNKTRKLKVSTLICRAHLMLARLRLPRGRQLVRVKADFRYYIFKLVSSLTYQQARIFTACSFHASWAVRNSPFVWLRLWLWRPFCVLLSVLSVCAIFMLLIFFYFIFIFSCFHHRPRVVLQRLPRQPNRFNCLPCTILWEIISKRLQVLFLYTA